MLEIEIFIDHISLSALAVVVVAVMRYELKRKHEKNSGKIFVVSIKSEKIYDFEGEHIYYFRKKLNSINMLSITDFNMIISS